VSASMRCTLLVALAACGAAPTTSHTNPESFDALSARVLDHIFKASPTNAVELGVHDYDGQTNDITAAGIAATVTTLRADKTALEQFEPHTPSEREQRDALLIHIRSRLFSIVELDNIHRNPMTVLGDFNLDAYIVRDYAPVAVRAAAIAKLCALAPAHLELARTSLHLPAPKVFIALAIDEFKGMATFADKDVRDALKGAAPPELDTCRDAFNAHAKWLEAQLQYGTNDFALGTDKYLQMIEEQEGIHIDLATLEKIAKQDLDRNMRAIEAAAHEVDPKLSVAAAIDKALADRPAANQVLATAEKQATEMRQFLIDHHIVSIPGNEQALVRDTPSFERNNSAMLSSAGAFEAKPLPSYYYIAPPDPAWTPAMQAEYIPSTWTLLFTTIHELYPGHFIDSMHARQNPSRVLKVTDTYASGEGWAHYCEEMMYDEGAAGTSPQAHIAQIKDALLRNVRFIVSIGEHTHGMSIEQAQNLFATEAFLDPGNAKQQAERGAYDPMFLAYTVGKLAILKLRTDWRVKHPNGTLQQFHDEFLSHGGAPLPVIRHAMIGDDSLL
jgi:uncharacterized protein (DUF885 family)